MDRLKLIGISGAAGAGKDTIGDILVNDYGHKRVSFAKPMKAAIETIFEVGPWIWERDVKEKPLLELHGFSPRFLAQTIGTEWGRGCLGDDFWVNLAMNKAHRIIENGDRVVITDVRFNNEAKAIQDYGGSVVGVIRPGLDSHSVRNHISEAGLDADLVTAVLLNDGRISDLGEKVAYILDELNSEELA